MKTYRDLQVCQKSMTLVAEIYKISKGSPKDEAYGLTSQMRRCAILIPTNMAEGYGRNGPQVGPDEHRHRGPKGNENTLCLCAFAPMNLSSYRLKQIDLKTLR
jgi:hypothetical protein